MYISGKPCQKPSLEQSVAVAPDSQYASSMVAYANLDLSNAATLLFSWQCDEDLVLSYRVEGQSDWLFVRAESLSECILTIVARL